MIFGLMSSREMSCDNEEFLVERRCFFAGDEASEGDASFLMVEVEVMGTVEVEASEASGLLLLEDLVAMMRD